MQTLKEKTLNADYEAMYKESIENPDQFWGEQAKLFLEWAKPFTAVNECSKEEGIVRWFTGGRLNVTSKYTYVCVNMLCEQKEHC